MLSTNEQVIDIYNRALKYVTRFAGSGIDPADFKERAKIYAINMVYAQREALYSVAKLDDFVPRKSLDFYETVSEKIKAL